MLDVLGEVQALPGCCSGTAFGVTMRRKPHS